MALDPMQTQLAEGELGSDANRIGRVAAAPGRSFADEQAACRPMVTPIDLDQANKANVFVGLVEYRPDEVGVAPGLNLLEELFLLAAGDTQIDLERRCDL